MSGIGQLIRQLPDIPLFMQGILRIHSRLMPQTMDRQQGQERSGGNGKDLQLQQILMLNLQIPISSNGNKR